MYWSDWGVVPRIEMASMDGANRTVLHNTSLTWPNALTLDIPTQTLYWADARLDKVESSSVDGTNRQLLAQRGVIHPFGIVVLGSQIYYTDWIHAIYYVNEIEEAAFPLIDQISYRPSGIQIVDQLKQPSGKYTTGK